MTEVRRASDAEPVHVHLDDELRTALHLAVRALEDQVSAAVASARHTGAATPEVTSFREAAARLRGLLAHG